MVPGVGDQRRTARGAGHFHRGPVQPFLDGDGDDRGPKGEAGGARDGVSALRVEDAVDGRSGDADAHEGERQADDGGDDGFVLAVAVGVVGVFGFGRKPQADQDGDVGGEIGQRVDGVGNQRLGTAEEAGGQLQAGQADVDPDGQMGDPAFRRHGGRLLQALGAGASGGPAAAFCCFSSCSRA